MTSEEIIALDCPSCRASIIQPLSWFKQVYATCPSCGGGLAATQFALQVEALEQALDDSVEEMVLGPPGRSCSCSCSCGCDSGGYGGSCGPVQ